MYLLLDFDHIKYSSIDGHFMESSTSTACQTSCPLSFIRKWLLKCWPVGNYYSHPLQNKIWMPGPSLLGKLMLWWSPIVWFRGCHRNPVILAQNQTVELHHNIHFSKKDGPPIQILHWKSVIFDVVLYFLNKPLFEGWPTSYSIVKLVWGNCGGKTFYKLLSISEVYWGQVHYILQLTDPDKGFLARWKEKN